LYDSSDAFRFLKQQFDRKNLKRHLSVGLANILNGQYKIFKDARSPFDFIKILEASLTFPGVFQPISAFGADWVSGSTIYEVDVITIVN